MSPRTALLWLVAGGCGGQSADPKGAPGGPAAGETGTPTAAPDTGPPDTAAPDLGDDTGAAGDTGTVAPCPQGLVVSLDSGPVASGATLPVGSAPSQAWDAVAVVSLHNPCADELRFLGHPDDWITGAGFSLATLPPVALAPGATATLSLAFTPGAAGPATGSLSLPHDHAGSPFTAALSATATAPLTFVAVGEGRRVSTSHDYGATFSTDTWDTLEGHTNALQRGMCQGAGRFVSVGGSDGAHWWTSPDGDTWTAHVESGGAIGDCAFGDGIFVAFAGDLLTSEDGESWAVSPQPYAPDHLRALAHGVDATGRSRFVAVGDGGRVALTEDGHQWAHDAHPISTDVRHVAFGAGTAGPVWVAVGSGGTVATSADGETWTEQRVGSATWTGVVWGGDRFLAGSGATLHSSPDGYAWSLVGASPVVPLAHLGSLWFGAAGAALLQSSDNGLSWTTLRPDDGGPGYAAAALDLEPAP